MPLDIQATFGPKRLFTESQIEVINRMRSDFLLLATKVSEKTHRNPMQEKGFEHLKEALHCFERSLTTGTFITPDIIADAFHTVERRDRKVDHIWVNPSTFCDIRKHCRDIFDAETKIENLKQNIQGVIWNAVVHISKLIPDSSVAVIGEDEENLTRESVAFEAQLYRF
jgi:hypothetical protein